MCLIIHEPTIPITHAFGRGAIGTSEIAASPKDPNWTLSSMQSYLATGGRIQFGGSQRNSRIVLHQCPPVGEAISTIGHLWAFESSKTGQTEALWKESRYVGDSNGYLPSTGSGIGVHYLVFGKTGRASSKTTFHPEIAQSRNHPPYSYSPWASFPNGTNLVQKRRSGFRSKKNAIIGLYRHSPRRGVFICFDELGPLQTILQGGQQWGKRAA